jgi:hypothetical protein
LPEKQRYKINVIPSNAGIGSRKAIQKSKSAEEVDKILEQKEDPGSPKKIPMNGPGIKEVSKDIEAKHLNLIANRARDIERKTKKMKSKLK